MKDYVGNCEGMRCWPWPRVQILSRDAMKRRSGHTILDYSPPNYFGASFVNRQRTIKGVVDGQVRLGFKVWNGRCRPCLWLKSNITNGKLSLIYAKNYRIIYIWPSRVYILPTETESSTVYVSRSGLHCICFCRPINPSNVINFMLYSLVFRLWLPLPMKRNIAVEFSCV